MKTRTMSETVVRALKTTAYVAAIIGMPDTVFFGAANPYATLADLAKSNFDRADSTWLSLIAYATKPFQKGKVGSVRLDEDGRVLAHKDKDPTEDYGNHWGQIAFSSSALTQLSEETPHCGYLIDPLLGQKKSVTAASLSQIYFDCGTLSE